MNEGQTLAAMFALAAVFLVVFGIVYWWAINRP
jgi:hypothetical protein